MSATSFRKAVSGASRLSDGGVEEGGRGGLGDRHCGDVAAAVSSDSSVDVEGTIWRRRRLRGGEGDAFFFVEAASG